jgi:hypothetical protein
LVVKTVFEIPLVQECFKHSCFVFPSQLLARGWKIIYNRDRENLLMLMSPDLMRLLLLICMLSMVVVAAFYLRQRKLNILEYAFWGLAAILVPILGPFFVIWLRPGNPRVPPQQ